MPFEASASGLAWMRTANFCWPMTRTWLTPLRVEMRCAIRVSAYSSTAESGRVAERRLRKMIGASAGFALMKLGGVVIWIGRRLAAEVSADCTSSAAPSMSRFRSNCMVIEVTP